MWLRLAGSLGNEALGSKSMADGAFSFYWPWVLQPLLVT
jgi:hypothetical protein